VSQKVLEEETDLNSNAVMMKIEKLWTKLG
jgi:hypothetical protein